MRKSWATRKRGAKRSGKVWLGGQKKSYEARDSGEGSGRGRGRRRGRGGRVEEDGRGRRSREGCSSSNFRRGEGGGKGEGGYQTHHMTKIFVGGGKERGRRREEGIFSEKERGKSGKWGKSRGSFLFREGERRVVWMFFRRGR